MKQPNESISQLPLELLHLIASFLTPQDLANCSRTNHEWNVTFNPHLWHSITLDRPHACQRFMTSATATPSGLAKNGHLIRSFSSTYYCLLKCMATTVFEKTKGNPGLIRLEVGDWKSPVDPILWKHQDSTKNVKHGPMFPDYEEHVLTLLKRNPHLQVLELKGEYIYSPERRTTVHFNALEQHMPAKVQKLCLCNIEIMEDKVWSTDVSEGDESATDDDDQPGAPSLIPLKQWASITELQLAGSTCWNPAITRLFARCPSLASIHLNLALEDVDLFTAVAKALKKYCPGLTKLYLRSESGSLGDEDLASLLECSRDGWTVLHMFDQFKFGELSVKALKRHYPTLVELDIRGCGPRDERDPFEEYDEGDEEEVDFGRGITSQDLQEILCSCPKLRKLEAAHEGEATGWTDPTLDVEDMRSSTWVCSELESLRLVIHGVPRPDVTLNYDGECLEGDPLHDSEKYTMKDSIRIQRKVCKQLGQLTHLRELCLGQDWVGFEDPEDATDESKEYLPLGYQPACVSLSLEGGLDLLKDLKQMRLLNVMQMEHRIGVEELEWMKKHWTSPQQWVIKGLYSSDLPPEEKDVREWVEEYHPRKKSAFSNKSRFC